MLTIFIKQKVFKLKTPNKNIILKYYFMSLSFSLEREIMFKEICVECIERFSWKVTNFMK